MDGLVLLELIFLMAPAFVAAIAWAIANRLPSPVRPAVAWLAAMALPTIWAYSVVQSGSSSWLLSIVYIIQAVAALVVVLLLERKLASK